MKRGHAGLGARAALKVLLLLCAALSGCAPAVPFPGAREGATPGGAPLFERPWRWTDENARELEFSEFRGRALVVTAMFTSCTTRCPRTIEKLRAMDEALRRTGVAGEFFLVTLDPERDSVERLERFKATRRLPSSWHMLRGGPQETRELGRMLGVRAIYDGDHIDHEVRIAVFDSGGRLVERFEGWDFDEKAAVGGL